MRARGRACACVRVFWFEVLRSHRTARQQQPVLHVAPVTARCNHCSAPPGARRARLWLCAALHAMLCVQRRRSALPTIATESTRTRCARRHRGGLHAAWWAARPLLQRTSDVHEARARAAEERGRALQRCLLLGRWRLWHAGSRPPWRSLADRVGSSHGQKRRPGPWCSTPPAKWQAPPAGLGAAGSGEPRGRWQGHGHALQGAGRRLAGRGHPAPWPGPNRPAWALRPCWPGSGRSHLAAAMAVDFGSLPCHNFKWTLRLAPVPVTGPAAGIGRVHNRSRRCRWVSYGPA
jgi:hypothetical protein